VGTLKVILMRNGMNSTLPVHIHPKAEETLNQILIPNPNPVMADMVMEPTEEDTTTMSTK